MAKINLKGIYRHNERRNKNLFRWQGTNKMRRKRKKI